MEETLDVARQRDGGVYRRMNIQVRLLIWLVFALSLRILW